MRRTGPRAVVAAVALLTCSACGSGFLLNGIPRGSTSYSVTTVVRAVPLLHLPLRRSGTGSESLGTFAIHGNVRVRATCVGSGTFELDFAAGHQAEGMLAHCRSSHGPLTLDSGSNFGVRSGVAHIRVRAPATARWRIDIVDRKKL